MKKFVVATLISLAVSTAATLLVPSVAVGQAFTFDFTSPVPPEGRANPFGLSPAQLAASRRAGLRATLADPEVNLGVAFPYRTLDNAVRMAQSMPEASSFLTQMGIARFGTTWEELFDGLGLMPYPQTEGQGAYFVPFPASGRPRFPIGAALQVNADGVEVYTQSCASCHSRNLFGRPVLGLANIQPRSQEFLNYGRRVSEIPSLMVFFVAEGDFSEYLAFTQAQENLSFHAAKNPIALGLDTPHAAAGLSLAMRHQDEYGTKSFELRDSPRPSPLATWPSDVKIATWWTAKYKNRFFVDGSVRGNPALNNYLWIKSSHGVDLPAFEEWIAANDRIIRDMTAAVFSAEAPLWTDFFAVTAEDVALAKRGEILFNDTCASCHGTYEKGWSRADAASLSLTEQFKTTAVRYHAETPRVNVGTDAHRAATTPMIAGDINRLHFARRFGIRIEAGPAGAYVPQPLVGIWARWPYLHNNSVPTLCELLKPAAQRSRAFFVVPAEDPVRDFDQACVGFPVGNAVAQEWRTEIRYFDTATPGLGNQGHEGFDLNDTQRREIIAFLKSL